MRHSNRGAFRVQLNFLRRQFLQDGRLPFTDVLTQQGIEQALTQSNISWLDRIFSPLVTLWVFLGQVLSGDQSCRAAASRSVTTTHRGLTACACSRSRWVRDRTAKATARSLPSEAAITSRALCPMLPVEPRTAICTDRLAIRRLRLVFRIGGL